MKLTSNDKARLLAVLARVDAEIEEALALGNGPPDFRGRHADRFVARLHVEREYGEYGIRFPFFEKRRNGTNWSDKT